MDLIFGLPDFFILIGVVIIVVGFILKVDTLFVVVLAAIVTGIVGKMSFQELMSTLGSAFVTNRYMTIFVLSLPVIGILERNGLKDIAAQSILKIKRSTSGRILSIYLFIRTLAACLGLRLGGHVQFIRPLILPMAEGALEKENPQVSKKQREKLKGLAGAVENFGNFFGQNAFMAAGGVLLITGTLGELGYEVEAFDIAKYSWIMAIAIIIIGSIYFLLQDKSLNVKEENNGE
ncbi:MAG: DUF969 domain-containing protein [Bacilli bacterium]